VKSLVWLVVSALAGTTVPSFAQAQLLPPAPHATPSLRAAVEAAWQRAIEATEAKGRVTRARADRAVAESPWAAPPSLELSHRDERVIDSSRGRETEVGIAWPMWLPGQRTARGRTADAELSTAEAGQHAARLRVAGEVRLAAWDLAARRGEMKLAEVQAQSLDALADDVERRIAAGDLARADALAARSEVLAARSASAEARRRLQAAEMRWRVLTGIEPVGDPQETPQAAPNTQHPELAVAALNVERARSRLDLLRVSRRDPPELMVRLREETAGNGAGGQHSVGVAVRVPFGTADRNVPRQAAATTELDLALAEERRLRERLEAEASSARSTLAMAEQQLSDEQSRAALLRERAQLIDKSFRAGESSLPEQLRALSAAAHADAASARARVALGLSRAQLHQTLGILP
jgi:cobalt-zinc-cadmium efflux system outer membrane protein